MAQVLKFKINLLDDGSVVTADGEYLGAWDTDGTDAIYQFTPDGSSVPTISHAFMGFLCERIDEWHSRLP